MITFYAAVGCYRIKTEDGRKTAYIQKLGKYHEISVPEFAIWSALLWQVMTYEELKPADEEIMPHQTQPVPDFDQLLKLLLKRKLVISGVGYTGVDALYRMLADAFVVPYRISAPRKAWGLIRLVLKGKIPVIGAISAAKENKLKPNEARVVDLVEQTPLSTAELVRCFDLDLYDVSTPEKVIAGIYTDCESTQQEIAAEQFWSPNTNVVLEAVSNLYLSRRVILEVP